ncbi:MAG: hypothetical protein B6242_04520 [Anaerolineaceae bacterium 4572_78]|nr:MAG: hypothetical protein B6242_04520 [Anaerolineaceae bacterium 4572_78]
MKNHVHNIIYWLNLILGPLLSLIVIGWAVWFLDWQQVWRELIGANYGWVLITTCSILVTISLQTGRWQTLFIPRILPFRHLFPALVMGQVANILAPARAGDVLRAYIVGKTTGISKARALGTIALEKLWDMLMLFLFTAGLSFYITLPDLILTPVNILMSIIFVGLSLLGVILWQRQRTMQLVTYISTWLGKRFSDRLPIFAENVFDGFTGLHTPQRIAITCLWSVLIWLTMGTTNYMLFWAFNLYLAPRIAFLLLVALRIGVAVPSLPGKIGVFQGICVFVLALFDVPYDIAFSYSLILHLITFLPPILLSAIFGFQLNLQIQEMRSL